MNLKIVFSSLCLGVGASIITWLTIDQTADFRGLVYNSIVKKCQLCPNDRPVEKDGKCEACPSNSHYDPVSKLSI